MVASPSSSEGDRVEYVQTAVSALVVAAVGIVLARLANQRFEALESRLAQFRDEMRADLSRLESQLDGRIDVLESKLDARFDGLDAKIDFKIDSVRADLTQIALAVGAAPRREIG
jgi:hypothetical protein